MKRLRKRPSIIGAAGLVVAVLWVLAVNWDPVASGHPSYLIFYFGSLALGAWLAWRWIVAPAEPAHTARSLIAAVLLLALAGLALWLSPLGADENALEALASADGVTVTESATRIVFKPATVDPTHALIFHAGARVDSRAYARTLLPLAQDGHRVVILKEPLGIAFLSLGFVDSEIDAHPEIEQWVVGGHSLGGVVASSDARTPRIDGLLLWASYPASDISDLQSFEVASVYGTNDGLSEPETVEASAVDLPPSTAFTEIEGAIHSHFGDYGPQPGDGEPGIEREAAQAEIVEASLSLLHAVIGAS